MSRQWIKMLMIILTTAGFLSCGKEVSDKSVFVASLSPQNPSEEVSMRWSPKGKQLSLKEKNGGWRLFLFSTYFSLLKKVAGDELGVKGYHGHRAAAITQGQ